MEERRRLPRVRTLKSGKIIVGPDTSVLDCTVRNLSAQGALLVVREIAGIPDEFRLAMESQLVRRKCRVRWRDENRLGVEFGQATDINSRFGGAWRG